MSQNKELGSDLILPLWQIGWHWLYIFFGAPIVGIVAGVVIDGTAGWIIGLGLFFIAPIVAVAGLIYVHLNKGDVINEGLDHVDARTSEIARLDDVETEKYTLVDPVGNSLPLLPKPERRVKSLFVADTLLLVHDSSKVYLPKLSYEVGQSTQEFYYDQITSVDFDPEDSLDDRVKKRESDKSENVSIKEGGVFKVNTSGGGGDEWRTTDDANEALHSVQESLRAYKTQERA